jgi:hypothetical protein
MKVRPIALFTLHAFVGGWGLFDASVCFPGVYYKGDFIGTALFAVADLPLGKPRQVPRAPTKSVFIRGPQI